MGEPRGYAGGRPSLLWVNHFAVPPSEGGGTRHFEMGRALAKRGWGVTIAASDFNLHAREYTRRAGADDRSVVPEEIDGVRFRWMWAAPYRSNDWRRAWNWLSFSRSLLRWRPEGYRPDLVIGSSPHLFAAQAGATLARSWDVPFVLEVRDLWPESVLAVGGRKGPGYMVLGRLARSLYRRADRIVCLARGAADYLEERGIASEKLLYVPNGVDPDAFSGIRRPERQGLTLVYAGAHGPANGLDAVLEAAEMLLESPEIRFLLVGDGAAKPRLVQRACERRLVNVEFRDPVPKARMPDLLAEVDAGLMVLRDTPLFSFGVSPNKLFDYFGAGLPAVCNVRGEVARMVEAAGGGVLAADSGGPALAEAIRRMAAFPSAERAEMGRSARAWVAREHGREPLAERLVDGLAPLLGA